MKTISIYPIIRIDIEVPDDYEGTIEEDTILCADFTETTFRIDGCRIDECHLCGFSDE